MKKARLSAEEEFAQYFLEVYGTRWVDLRQALLNEPRKTVLRNPFGLQDYSLDEASLLPVRNLELVADLSSADFCASPGGKLIAAIFAVGGHGRWMCSDLSPARVKRLKAVLHDCLPPEILRNVEVVQTDASRWGLRRPEEFDRVLLDAPCSGERHLLESPKELARWSLNGSKRLAVRQHALLCSAFDSVRVGGRVVYSTCSISPLENDGVIEKLMKSRRGKFSVKTPRSDLGEATEHGWIILPDRAGCGPIYCAVLERTE